MYFRNCWYAAIFESHANNPKLKTGETVSRFELNNSGKKAFRGESVLENKKIYCVNGSKRLSPTPSVSNLSLRPCRYLSTVTRSSGRASVDGFRRERLQRFATFDSLSVQRSVEARKRMERRTIVCYLGGIFEAIGAVGANFRLFSFGGPVEPLRWSAQPW